MSTSAGLPTTLSLKNIPSNFVYAPHYYDPLCTEGKPYKGANKRLMEKAVKIKVSESEKFDVSMFYGEFGIAFQEGYVNSLKDFCTLADRYNLGWTYWSYDKVSHGGFGLLEEDTTFGDNASIIFKPFPSKVAGTKLKFRNESNRLIIDYIATVGTTEIIVPLNYTNINMKVNGKIYETRQTGGVFKYAGTGQTNIILEYELIP
jgi:hypothetical protein